MNTGNLETPPVQAQAETRLGLGDRAELLGAGASALAGASSKLLPSTQFVWGAGVECSFLPHLNVDQFEWTQHNRFWKDDFRRAKEELGISALRYSFPWHVTQRERGKFDWSMPDERIAELQRLEIEPYLDVMHFGTPLWLKQAVGDAEFPDALETYTRAMVSRYRGAVKVWCPFNEPLVSALFSGDFGFWPPHSRRLRGYMPVLSRIVQGVNRSIRAIRQEMPEATVLLCDNVENYKTRVPSLQEECRKRNLRRFIVMDLLTGRVDREHPLFNWVLAYGMSELDIEWFRANPQTPDILGLDYYPNCDWQLDKVGEATRQRRAESPAGLYGVGTAYYNRYGIPMMLTETSIEGQSINREIWLDSLLEDARRLREEGVPLTGFFWWPLVDQLDWDGALTHRVGKIHQVGLFNLQRRADGALSRQESPLVRIFREHAAGGDKAVGKLEFVARPAGDGDDGDPIVVEQARLSGSTPVLVEVPSAKSNGNGNGNGKGNGKSATATLGGIDPAAGLAAEPAAASRLATGGAASEEKGEIKATDRYGIVVFSHLRWGFVWQRPQQFLSRFARKHPILFLEEPMFDIREGASPRVDLHKVMPNVTVACPHLPPSFNRNPRLPSLLRQYAQEAIDQMNETSGAFDAPLLWYYSPMDSAWSLGHFRNRGIVYDCMDELSQFTGAPPQLVRNEARLMEHADVVFTGGYNLGEKKKQQHPNVHIFGCGVEFEHFNKAGDPHLAIPPDIDFLTRPILGWFGVVDERVDYAMVGEMARLRPDWSFAMVGPVVKVDPNLLPHSPNLHWLGGRDYQQLPSYVGAFDVNMMCFAINKSTEFINPTKGLEYMATGKPIVSTHVKDVVRQWSDIVYLAKGAEEFIAAAESALDENNPERNARVQRGLELARRCGWESTVQQMQDLIRQAITKDQRRSARKIEPLTEVEMNYVFQATQGS